MNACITYAHFAHMHRMQTIMRACLRYIHAHTYIHTHGIAWHQTTQHHSTSHYMTYILACTACIYAYMHYRYHITPHYSTSRSTPPHHMTSHDITARCIASRHTTPRSITSDDLTSNYNTRMHYMHACTHYICNMHSCTM